MWLNNNTPAIVESVESIFTELARALGKTELTRGRQPLAGVLKRREKEGT